MVVSKSWKEGRRLEISPGVYLVNNEILNGVVIMILVTCPFCCKSVALVGSLFEISYCEDSSSFCHDHYSVVCNYNEGGCGASIGLFYKSELDAISAFINRADFVKVTKTAEEVLQESELASPTI